MRKGKQHKLVFAPVGGVLTEMLEIADWGFLFFC